MAGKCQVAECEYDAITRGYCEMHFRRVLRTGDPGPPGPLRSRGICKAELCEELVDARGLCHGHYQRVQRKSRLPLDSPLRKGRSMCQVPTCDRDAERRGYCQAHYKRVLKHGHPQADIPLREVDGSGHMSHGYQQVNLPKELRHLSRGLTKIAEHRFVMAQHLDGRSLPTSMSTTSTASRPTIDSRISNCGRHTTRAASG
jgi:hypothetical protein